MLFALEECSPGLALKDIWKERKLTKEFYNIYILSSTWVLPPPQDLMNCNKCTVNFFLSA